MEKKSQSQPDALSNLKSPVIEFNENTTEDSSPTSITVRRNSNLINTSDVAPELRAKLRGDAIGETLYSESFVAKTLLQLSDLKWSRKLEEDLCFLWDMTLDQDVCDYLLKLSYPNIACDVLSKYDEKRLMEIVIGILANICCIIDTTDISDEQTELVLSFLSSDNPLILVQVARFIKAVAYNRETLSFINETTMGQLNFILMNSFNNELLLNGLDAVSKITADSKLEADLLHGELVKSSVAAYQCICNNERERLSLDIDQIETNQQRTALTHLIQIVSNICCYINADSGNRLLDEVNEDLDQFLEELSKVFGCYSKDESLLPVSEELQFYVDALVFIFQVLNVRYHGKIFFYLINITSILLKNKCEEVGLFLELDCYFISVGKLEVLKRDLRDVAKGDVVSVFSKIKADKIVCEFPYEENLNAVLSEFKT